MKNLNITPQNVLVNQLQSLYYGENLVRFNFDHGDLKFRTISDKNIIENYLLRADDILLKLDRIFRYLMVEPQTRKNSVVYELIREYKSLTGITAEPHLHDVLLLNLLLNVTDYKIINFKTAYLLSILVDMDSVSDLIQQMLEDEQAFKKNIEDMAISEFNQVPHEP